jgi:hypothetical protein
MSGYFLSEYRYHVLPICTTCTLIRMESFDEIVSMTRCTLRYADMSSEDPVRWPALIPFYWDLFSCRE